MTYADIIDRLGTLLNDEGMRWSRHSLLFDVFEGVKAVAAAKEEECVVTEAVTLDPGTKQTLPGIRLLGTGRNLGGGATPGKVPALVDYNLFARLLPHFGAEADAGAVDYVLADPKEPRAFHVVPPAAGQVLELRVAKDFTAPGGESDTVPLPEIYEEPVLNFALWRALSRETSEASAQKAAGFYNAYATAVGLRIQGELR